MAAQTSGHKIINPSPIEEGIFEYVAFGNSIKWDEIPLLNGLGIDPSILLL